MRRPWLLATFLGGCLAVVFAAMIWLTGSVMRLDRQRLQAADQAQFEANLRLALWRLDTAVSPILAQENALPYFAYQSFIPNERQYSDLSAPLRSHEPASPSKLLTNASSNILLHFQVDPRGAITASEAPEGEWLQRAVIVGVPKRQLDQSTARLQEVRRRLGRKDVEGLRAQCESSVLQSALPPTILNELGGAADQVQLDQNIYRKIDEQNNANVPESNSQASDSFAPANREFQNRVLSQQRSQTMMKNVSPIRSPTVREDWLTPLWHDGPSKGDAPMLLLVRRVEVQSQSYLQCVWLNWPELSKSLLDQTQDLLVDAKLTPVSSPNSSMDLNAMMATLPAAIVAHPISTATVGLTSLDWSLIAAWIGFLTAAAATAGLIAGVIVLSERRATFVSAVTHELRTPITTFRMYSDMLADGMVLDPEKRQEYLQTLQAEADRLGHLVENVLGYARLERGRAGGRPTVLSTAAMLSRVRERLSQRAAQARMNLTVDFTSHSEVAQINVDPLAVEQILFNLVDNACKYARGSDDPRIVLEIRADDQQVHIAVRDFGAGISPPDRRKLFQAFSKSAQAAAESAPGIGLGLALSRRLARDLGGDLKLRETSEAGSRFVLSLPRA